MPTDAAGLEGWRFDSLPRILLIASLVAGAVAALIFLAFPQIDIWAAKSVYHAGPGRPELHVSWLTPLRHGAAAIFWASAATAVAGLVVASRRRSDWLGLNAARWLFICICLVVGPGLVANSLLKENWGRARPKQIAEFGGDKSYTPPLVITNQCKSNCSFVSGEASALFMPFYAAALVVPQGSVLLLAAGTIAGLAAGAIRMGLGAHFLSDVVFAGIFMALAAALIHRLMFAWPWARLLEAVRARRPGRRAPAA